MRRQIYNIFIWVVSILTVALAFILIGNIITIGDKIATHVHPYGAYAFYALIGLLSIIFILVPIIKVAAMPSFPELDVLDNEKANLMKQSSKGQARINKLAKRLGIDNKATDIDTLTESVRGEINSRLAMAKSEILKSAALSFGSTALSQNSTIDALSVLMINCKLIHRIISSVGFRPSARQTTRIYINVIFSAFFAHITQSGVEQSATIIMNQFVGGIKKIPFSDMIVGSAIDGTINAMMTLRVGFLTISYLKRGAKGKISDAENSAAIKNAINTLPEVIGNKTMSVLEFVTKFFKRDKTADAAA